MTGRFFMRALLAAILLTGLTSVSALADDWKPIDPAHLAMKTPTVEPDADAEAIFWEVHVADERDANVWRPTR